MLIEPEGISLAQLAVSCVFGFRRSALDAPVSVDWHLLCFLDGVEVLLWHSAG